MSTLVLLTMTTSRFSAQAPEPSAVKLRDQRNIGDAYQQAFDRVLRDLKQEAG